MEHLNHTSYTPAVQSGIVVVDFYAQRCPPCKMIAPYLDQLATHYDGIVAFYKVDVDAEQLVAATQSITAMPTMKVYNNGVVVKTIVGADLQTLQTVLAELVAASQQSSMGMAA